MLPVPYAVTSVLRHFERSTPNLTLPKPGECLTVTALDRGITRYLTGSNRGGRKKPAKDVHRRNELH